MEHKDWNLTCQHPRRPETWVERQEGLLVGNQTELLSNYPLSYGCLLHASFLHSYCGTLLAGPGVLAKRLGHRLTGGIQQTSL